MEKWFEVLHKPDEDFFFFFTPKRTDAKVQCETDRKLQRDFICEILHNRNYIAMKLISNVFNFYLLLVVLLG